MPLCSACQLDQPRQLFSNAQLKKLADTRHCKTCVEFDLASVKDLHVLPEASFTTGTSLLHSIDNSERERLSQILQDLALTFLSVDRKLALPTHLQDQETLTRLLTRVLLEEADLRAVWLVEPLVVGLYNGYSAINALVQPPEAGPDGSFPILFWLCQWKLTARLFGWTGSDDFVSLVLATPGLKVNQTLSNGTNAAFFCVKYGSAKVLKMLIDAGINMQHRDLRNRTMLCNALEYPDPEIIKLVLDHVPATEMFLQWDSTSGQEDRKISAADRILTLYGNINTFTEQGQRVAGPLSWRLMGTPPPVQNVAESLILVLQRGASLTVDGSYVPFQSLGYVHKGVTTVPGADDFVKLGQSMLGFWLPPAAKRHIEQVDRERNLKERSADQETEECSLCLKPPHKKSTLFCGHSYCRKCIMEYAKQDNGSGCPVCRLPLCRDVTGPTTSNVASGTAPNRKMRNSIARAEELLNHTMRNLVSMSDNQVAREAMAQGFFSSQLSKQALHQKLREKVQQGHKSAAQEIGPITINRTSRDNHEQLLPVSFKGQRMVELSTTVRVFDNRFMIIPPRRGPVMVQIMIKGIPVLANVSNNSRYTTLSSSVVENFGLRRLESLQSRKFRCGLTGKRVKDMRLTCLEEFEFSIGGVTVVLRNALEASSDDNVVGVQLGVDFFLSGRFCVVDVLTGGETNDLQGNSVSTDLLFRCDGSFSWLPSDIGAGSNEESLRYYAHNGQSCNVPLHHFNPNKTEVFKTITVNWDVDFKECNWCGRNFPKGMLSCALCEGPDGAHYCAKECQEAAWIIHRKWHKNVQP